MSSIVLTKPTAIATDNQAVSLPIVELFLTKYKKTTAKIYRTAIAQFLQITQLVNPKDIAYRHLTLFEAALKARELKPNSVATKVNAVKAFARYLWLNGVLGDDVARNIRGFKVGGDLSPLTERLVSDSDVEKLVKAISNVRDRIIVNTFIALGLRVSELVGLTWDDVRDRTLTVRGKGGKTRYLLIPKWLLGQWVTLGERKGNIFKNLSGNALGTRYVWEFLKKAAKKAGITEKISPHWLRHFHAVTSLKNNKDIYLLQRSLGHSSIATTEKYLHIMPDECSSDFIPEYALF